MDIIEKLAADGQLTDEQVERIGKNVAEFMDAVRADPAFRKEAMEKLAFSLPSYLKDPLKRTGFMQKAMGHAWDVAPMAVGAGAIAGGFGLAKHLGEKGFGAARDKIEKARAYKAMVEENPQLKHIDPNVTQKAFNTLHRFNPQYAKDPMVAGTFVNNVADQERLDIGTVNSLVQARRNMADGGGKPMDPLALAVGMGKATEALGKSQRASSGAAEANVNFLGAQERLNAAEAEAKAGRDRAEFWSNAKKQGLEDDGSGEDPGA